MGSIFVDTNVYMLHMMYQAMGVCLYMQDWDGAMKYGEKIVEPYRYTELFVLLISLVFDWILTHVSPSFSQCALPSILSECGIYVPEAWKTLHGP